MTELAEQGVIDGNMNFVVFGELLSDIWIFDFIMRVEWEHGGAFEWL